MEVGKNWWKVVKVGKNNFSAPEEYKKWGMGGEEGGGWAGYFVYKKLHFKKLMKFKIFIVYLLLKSYK